MPKDNGDKKRPGFLRQMGEIAQFLMSSKKREEWCEEMNKKDEERWRETLKAALAKQGTVPAGNMSNSDCVILTVIKKADYDAKYARFRKEVPATGAQTTLDPHGSRILEVDELTDAGVVTTGANVTLHLDLTIDELEALLGNKLLGIEALPFGTACHVEFMTMQPPLDHAKRTLRSLGIQSGDVVVLKVFEWFGKAPGMMGSIPESIGERLLTRRTLDDFFATVVTKDSDSEIWLHRRPDAWKLGTGKKSHPWPLCIGALLLYTEEDQDIAVYVRRYFSVLHRMSGCHLMLYTFEHCPPAGHEEQMGLRSYWRRVLPPWVYSVWCQVGLLKTKPYPSKEIYDIAESLRLAPRDLPCVILFKDWREVASQGMVLPLRGSTSAFFRHFCSDVRDSLELIRKDRPMLEFLKELEFDDFRSAFRRTHSGKLICCGPSELRSKANSSGDLGRKLFLSHSSADKEFVECLANDLRNNGVGVWLDKCEIRVGDSIIDRISQGIEQSAYLAIVLSRASVESQWVRKELNAALMQELADRRVVVLPILLEDCKMPVFLREKRYADFSHDYRQGLTSLLAIFDDDDC